MTVRQLQEQVEKDLNTTRQTIYDETKKTSDYADMVAEKAAADTAYLAMMMDIDLDEEDTDGE